MTLSLVSLSPTCSFIPTCAAKKILKQANRIVYFGFRIFIFSHWAAEKQNKVWDPLLDWVEQEIGQRPLVTSSIFGTEQPPHVLVAMKNALHQSSDWQLAGIDWLAGTARSLVVALAIARGRLGIEEAIDVIRLEENHQVCLHTAYLSLP